MKTYKVNKLVLTVLLSLSLQPFAMHATTTGKIQSSFVSLMNSVKNFFGSKHNGKLAVLGTGALVVVGTAAYTAKRYLSSGQEAAGTGSSVETQNSNSRLYLNKIGEAYDVVKLKVKNTASKVAKTVGLTSAIGWVRNKFSRNNNNELHENPGNLPKNKKKATKKAKNNSAPQQKSKKKSKSLSQQALNRRAMKKHKELMEKRFKKRRK